MRFDYNNPPHMHYPAVTDWHVYDEGERISVATLVRRANELQREIKSLKKQLEPQEEESHATVSN